MAEPARRIAFDVLRQVHGSGAYANLALGMALAEAGLDRRAAALVTELVAGTCRAQGTYDQIIVAAGGRALNTLQPAVVDLLRLGTHQVLRMRGASAIAVSTTVDLAGATVGRRVAGLVNAILRRVAAEDWDTWMDRLGGRGDSVAALALRTCHPGWIVQAYVDLLGDEAEAALAANNAPPQTTLVVRPGLATLDELLEAGATPGHWSPWAASWGGDPGRLEAVRQGRVGVEDEGSQLVAVGLTRPSAPAGAWLDLCAGPGGKAALLAGLARHQGVTLLANEVSPHRARLVAQALRAYGTIDPTVAPVEGAGLAASAVSAAAATGTKSGTSSTPVVIVADGRQPAWPPACFARVLADVPCTGLGALRRRPDARWRKQPSDLAGLVRLQRALLNQALDSCRPGGLVAYATCSPHPAETVAVVAAVREERGDVTVVPAGEVWPEVPQSTVGDFLQLWPHRHGTDAMFCALLRRR